MFRYWPYSFSHRIVVLRYCERKKNRETPSNFYFSQQNLVGGWEGVPLTQSRSVALFYYFVSDCLSAFDFTTSGPISDGYLTEVETVLRLKSLQERGVQTKSINSATKREREEKFE
jgi:hypothetical protein